MKRFLLLGAAAIFALLLGASTQFYSPSPVHADPSTLGWDVQYCDTFANPPAATACTTVAGAATANGAHPATVARLTLHVGPFTDAPTEPFFDLATAAWTPNLVTTGGTNSPPTSSQVPIGGIVGQIKFALHTNIGGCAATNQVCTTAPDATGAPIACSGPTTSPIAPAPASTLNAIVDSAHLTPPADMRTAGNNVPPPGFDFSKFVQSFDDDDGDLQEYTNGTDPDDPGEPAAQAPGPLPQTQKLDPATADGTHPAGTLPLGVTHMPDFIPRLAAAAGFGSVFAGRGYAIAQVIANVNQVDVNFLALDLTPIGGGYVSITTIGIVDPAAKYNAATAATSVTCTPFTSETLALGVVADNPDTVQDESAGVNGFACGGVPCGGTNTILKTNDNTKAGGATEDYFLGSSTAEDYDQDGTPAEIDNCDAVSNPGNTDGEVVGTHTGDGLGDACDPAPGTVDNCTAASAPACGTGYGASLFTGSGGTVTYPSFSASGSGGTVSYTVNSMTDTSKAFTAGALVGGHITVGTQTRTITFNNATTVSVADNFAPPPAGGAAYTINQDQVTDTSKAFAVNSLVGVPVILVPAGYNPPTTDVQTRTITANTATSVALNSAFLAPVPNAGDAYIIGYCLAPAQASWELGFARKNWPWTLDQDIDCDGAPNWSDNCLSLTSPLSSYNPTQRDSDSDGVGDPCDPKPSDATPTLGNARSANPKPPTSLPDGWITSGHDHDSVCNDPATIGGAGEGDSSGSGFTDMTCNPANTQTTPGADSSDDGVLNANTAAPSGVGPPTGQKDVNSDSDFDGVSDYEESNGDGNCDGVGANGSRDSYSVTAGVLDGAQSIGPVTITLTGGGFNPDLSPKTTYTASAMTQAGRGFVVGALVGGTITVPAGTPSGPLPITANTSSIVTVGGGGWTTLPPAGSTYTISLSFTGLCWKYDAIQNSNASLNPNGGGSPDSDNDGCSNNEEAGNTKASGGNRDALYPYDFTDVPTSSSGAGFDTTNPAAPKGTLQASSVRSKAVTLSDVSTVLAYVGRVASNYYYKADLNGDTFPDGLQMDRQPADATHLATQPNNPGAITLQDVSVTLGQVGASCVSQP